ncbi:MAG TPA: peptide synthase, partial [Elusimicrobiota bacterium]|nr:peptide synthase [Elusimicrobiota bacterium]
YGATESLPVALIGSSEILGETAELTERGRGVCVGRPAAGVDVAVIRITDAGIPQWRDALRLAPGEVGEIVVKGPVVTREYFRRPEADAAAKIADETAVRHRMGDLGYIDERGRLWFCGRKAHRIKTENGELYTIPIEGIFNSHPAVKRTALVGVGLRAVLCVELEPGMKLDRQALTRELLSLAGTHDAAKEIKIILYHPSFPVDIRHNAKIFREKLAAWAKAELAS